MRMARRMTSEYLYKKLQEPHSAAKVRNYHQLTFEFILISIRVLVRARYICGC